MSIDQIIKEVPSYLNPDELTYWNRSPRQWKEAQAARIKALGESGLFSDEADYYHGFEELSENISITIER